MASGESFKRSEGMEGIYPGNLKRDLQKTNDIQRGC